MTQRELCARGEEMTRKEVQSRITFLRKKKARRYAPDEAERKGEAAVSTEIKDPALRVSAVCKSQRRKKEARARLRRVEGQTVRSKTQRRRWDVLTMDAHAKSYSSPPRAVWPSRERTSRATQSRRKNARREGRPGRAQRPPVTRQDPAPRRRARRESPCWRRLWCGLLGEGNEM